MNWYKIAKNTEFGECLQCAFKALEKHPNWTLMMGPAAYDHPECTSHFWTVDEEGNVQDWAKHVVPDDYDYTKGVEKDPEKVREELEEDGFKEASVSGGTSPSPANSNMSVSTPMSQEMSVSPQQVYTDNKAVWNAKTKGKYVVPSRLRKKRKEREERKINERP